MGARETIAKRGVMTFYINSKTHGKHAVKIDDEDYEKVSGFAWYIKKDGYRIKAVVASTYEKGKRGKVRLHRLIVPFAVIDHIDGNPLNNMKSNLRECSLSENQQNRGKQINNSTGYKGVFIMRNKGREYIKAAISVKGKQHHLGIFKTKEQAALAYNEAAKKYHGEFARLNKIKEIKEK